MTDLEKVQAMKELVVTQCESMGFAVVSIDGAAPGTFMLEIIDGSGPRNILVTVMLQLEPMNAATNKRE